MKPIEPKLVTTRDWVTYWQCAVISHRHETESAAKACLKKLEVRYKMPLTQFRPRFNGEYVKIEHWDCGKRDHRHKAELDANACIEKRAKAHRTGPKWTEDRIENLMYKYRNGYTKTATAKELGLSLERIRQIIKTAIRKNREREFKAFRANSTPYFHSDEAICLSAHECLNKFHGSGKQLSEILIHLTGPRSPAK